MFGPGVNTLFGSYFFFAADSRRQTSGPKCSCQSAGDMTPVACIRFDGARRHRPPRYGTTRLASLPPAKTRQPAADLFAVVMILGTELPPETALLVENDE